MNAAWKFQIPSFILADKTLSEGTYSIDATIPQGIQSEPYPLWEGNTPYLRYADTPSGISSLAFPQTKGAVVKVNSYAHDEAGITTEEADQVARMAEKRLRKWKGLREEMNRHTQVNGAGNPDASTALLCWGSTKGVCTDIAAVLGLRVIQPVVLSPFPVAQLNNAIRGVKRLIVVEENATAQLAALAEQHGIRTDDKILRYDGRPFTPDDLLARVREAIT
jgi:2-oxoglutarate ferredoxin oxidoreductase subunit alpha